MLYGAHKSVNLSGCSAGPHFFPTSLSFCKNFLLEASHTWFFHGKPSELENRANR